MFYNRLNKKFIEVKFFFQVLCVCHSTIRPSLNDDTKVSIFLDICKKNLNYFTIIFYFIVKYTLYPL